VSTNVSHFDQEGNYVPNFMDKIVGFRLHYRDWKAAGYPLRGPAEVTELFGTHCNPPEGRCELYDPKARAIPLVGRLGVCRGFGCHVSGEATELDNAIAYPTKKCPLGKFDSVVDPPENEEEAKTPLPQVRRNKNG